ncbi:IS701 family transposase [Streptomyces sp. WI04-05B]|uniref:IS701 family transposase n=1 Tax=Streptomyces echiniscabiei TaxID=3028708 RepID=UPI00299FDF08|nr:MULTISPECIES: transposase [unclassified Streptomyces]MDX2546835.1 transposase [Streptomyces sp. WI04-05B]MDX2589631.1 transposase [Streptomyces sp. WI04-05A]
MTARRPCPPAPGPFEDYAARFDDIFFSSAQRRGFREYLTGLLAPRERNKTITCLAGAEGMPGAQRLQFFLSESPWEAELVNDRRLELLREEPATAPHEGGVIVIDDSGDRKDGTAHVGRQWLGKTDNSIITVTTVWTDGRVYYPLHATAYIPAHHFARGRADPVFRTNPQLAAALAARGKEAGFGCRAVVADCAYSVSDTWYLALREAGLAYVVALKPHRGTWAPADQPHTPIEAAHVLAWRDARDPGDWTPVERHFRDGHTETWWACAATAPTQPACRRRPPGTWPPTCPTPTHPTPPPARTRLPTSPRSSASTDCGRGSSRATSRSRTNSAGPTPRSAPTAPSAATKPWSTAPSPSAGTSGSPHPDPWTPPRRTPAPTKGQRGTSPAPPAPTALLEIFNGAGYVGA